LGTIHPKIEKVKTNDPRCQMENSPYVYGQPTAERVYLMSL